MQYLGYNGDTYTGQPFFNAVSNSGGYGESSCNLAPFDDVVAEFGNIDFFLQKIVSSPSSFLPGGIPTTIWVGADYTYYNTTSKQLVPVPDTPERQFVTAEGYLSVCCINDVCAKNVGGQGSMR